MPTVPKKDKAADPAAKPADPKATKAPAADRPAKADPPAKEPAAKKPAAKKPKKAPDRPVVHPEPRYALFLEPPAGRGEFDSAAAWEHLGATTDDPGDGTDPLFDHPALGPVWCKNNTRNRPLSMPNVLDLKQRILNRQWRFNGEPFVVGVTDEVLSGQHTMVALVLADHEVARDDADPHWARLWKDRGGVVAIPKAVVYGVDESDEVVNTIDTGRSRTVGDVLYRSAAFRALPKDLRAKAARAAEGAVRLLWERAGGKTDAWAPRLNQAEATGFVEDHPSLVRAVRHVLEEDGDGRLASAGVRPGTAAGLMYLMAAEDDDGERYRKDGSYTEKKLRLAKWDRAEEFWLLLAQNSDPVAAVRPALAAAADLGQRGRLAVLVRAWERFRDGKPLAGKAAQAALAPRTVDNGDGTRSLADHPSLEGIDLGPADVPDPPAGPKKARPAPAGPGGTTFADRLVRLRERYGQRVLGFPLPGGGYRLWDEDAGWAAKLLGKTAGTRAEDPGARPLRYLDVPADEWEDAVRVFEDNDATVGTVRPDLTVLDAAMGDVVPPENAGGQGAEASADDHGGRVGNEDGDPLGDVVEDANVPDDGVDGYEDDVPAEADGGAE